jgi:AP-2 complex subunit beta-1
MFLRHYIAPSGYGGLPYVLRSPQGKVAELRQELASGGKKDKNHAAKKIALKKIVANMTMSNNDMVALFPDVVGCMQIPSLEIKKM